MYSILYNDKEAVIYNVAKDYNQDQDFIRLEYESWVSLIALKENFGENDNKKRPINETGSEIIIYQDEMNNLKIIILFVYFYICIDGKLCCICIKV